MERLQQRVVLRVLPIAVFGMPLHAHGKRLGALHADRLDLPVITHGLHLQALDTGEAGREPLRQRERYGHHLWGQQTILARRLAERGTRFIQLYHKDWDHHGGVKDGVTLKAAEIDRACMALITDLKQRGMLKDTLIVWAGEFGRTPMSQGGSGRDHHNAGFSIWLAGGGIKGGISYGATDELGYSAVENIVNVHDLHATVLRLLGIEHSRLSVKFQGLDVKLSGVEGAKPIQGIMA